MRGGARQAQCAVRQEARCGERCACATASLSDVARLRCLLLIFAPFTKSSSFPAMTLTPRKCSRHAAYRAYSASITTHNVVIFQHDTVTTPATYGVELSTQLRFFDITTMPTFIRPTSAPPLFSRFAHTRLLPHNAIVAARKVRDRPSSRRGNRQRPRCARRVRSLRERDDYDCPLFFFFRDDALCGARA